MRLLRLSLPDFKNLQGFSIDFDRSSPTTVLVGKNGSGKSNLIEALVRVFRDLDAGLGRHRTEFAYELDYEKSGKSVSVSHDPTRSRGVTRITVDGKRIQHGAAVSTILPDTVFAYYSGPSNRLESIFDAPLAAFRDAMIKRDESARQRLIYGRLIHSQFVLLSFLAEGGLVDFPFLSRELGIEAVESILFVMKQPYWANRKQGLAEKHSFWGAAGVVRSFLEELYQAALAPLQLEQRNVFGIRQSKTLEYLYLFLPGHAALQQFVSRLTHADTRPRARELFTIMESAFVSDLIADVRVQLRKRNVSGRVTFSELSEGEQQLLMVLGLLRFTKEEESLFLLDEPDTHLNPAWSLRFLDLVEEAVGERHGSQLIVASHDPVSISLLRSEQVRQLSSDDGRVVASVPEDDPIRLGVAGVLLSELFGFRSMLAPEMLDLMEKRDRLRRQDPEKLTGGDKEELDRLQAELSEIDYSGLHPDPMYARFLSAMLRHESLQMTGDYTLDRSEVVEQRRLSEAVVRELLEEDGEV